mgnify:FL=1|jgi:hypothetical protein
MTNYYALLGLPESLSPDPASIESSWRAQSGTAAGADAGPNEARATLSDPVTRLAHWLALRSPEGTADRTIAPVLMDLFSKISPTIETTDALLTRHRKATTALARAVLTKEAIAAQLQIQALLQQIQPLRDAIVNQFPEFETNATRGDFQKAFQALGQLKFLKRWEMQCRERLLSLIAC